MMFIDCTKLLTGMKFSYNKRISDINLLKNLKGHLKDFIEKIIAEGTINLENKEKLYEKVDDICKLIEDEITRRMEKQAQYYDHNNDNVSPINKNDKSSVDYNYGSNSFYTNLDQSEPSQLKSVRLSTNQNEFGVQ